jgi:hypothetical protein
VQVIAAAAVRMHVDEARHYYHVRCINDIALFTGWVSWAFHSLDVPIINGYSAASNICCGIREASIA